MPGRLVRQGTVGFGSGFEGIGRRSTGYHCLARSLYGRTACPWDARSNRRVTREVSELLFQHPHSILRGVGPVLLGSRPILGDWPLTTGAWAVLSDISVPISASVLLNVSIGPESGGHDWPAPQRDSRKGSAKPTVGAAHGPWNLTQESSPWLHQ